MRIQGCTLAGEFCPVAWRGPQLIRRLVLGVALLTAALGLFGWAEAAQDPQVVRYTVALAKLPPGTKPIRIVQLSDTHGSWIDMPPTRLQRIVDQANALHPDLVVLTGDYIGGKIVDWPHIRLEAVLLPFDRLQAPLGIYAVAGNHDTVYWTRHVLARTHVHFLVSDWVDAGPVTIAGANDLTNISIPGDESRTAVTGARSDKPLILIAHEPNYFAALPAEAGLMIAGHTHGGQIMLPWIGPLYLDDYLAAHRRGVFHEHGQTLVVSSGLGTSVVPIRIGVPPEIVEITLLPAQPGRKSGTDR